MHPLRLALTLCLLWAAPAWAQGSEPAEQNGGDAPREADGDGPLEGAGDAPEQTTAAELAFAVAKDDLKAGRVAEAADGFRVALRLDPEFAAARRYLAECHLALGEADVAKEIVQGGDPGGRIFDPTSPPPPVAQEPAPEPAPEAASEPESAAEPTDASPKERRDLNPRASRRGGVGVAALAPVVGAGVWIEGRPNWFVAVLGTAGGAAWGRYGKPHGVGAFAVEVAISPVPFVVTPELSVGFVGLLGDGAWELTDGRVRSPLVGPSRRGLPYARVALRFDARRWIVSVGATLAPGEGGTPAPFPSVRVGGALP